MGTETSDDAAVWRLNDTQALVAADRWGQGWRDSALTVPGGTSDARFIRALCPVVEFVRQRWARIRERVGVMSCE